MSKFLIVWNALISLAKIVTSFTKTKKDEQVVEKLDDIVSNCTSITDKDIAKIKQVAKENVETLKEIKEVIKK